MSVICSTISGVHLGFFPSVHVIGLFPLIYGDCGGALMCTQLFHLKQCSLLNVKCSKASQILRLFSSSHLFMMNSNDGISSIQSHPVLSFI